MTNQKKNIRITRCKIQGIGNRQIKRNNYYKRIKLTKFAAELNQQTLKNHQDILSL